MQIIIISGFLGSGKTTSIIRMGKHFKNKGYSVAVLVNDIGDVGVDGHVISENGLESKEMPRGCICCTLRYALEGNISLVQAQYDPDILLIEPTGVAFPLRVKEQIEKMNFGPEVIMGPIVALIDGSKFGDLMQHSQDAIIRQMENADVILLNKKDLLNPQQLAEIEASVKRINSCAHFYVLSLKEEDETFTDVADILESGFRSTLSDEEGLKGSVPEAPESEKVNTSGTCAIGDDDFNHFNVSSYADSYAIKTSLGREAATSLALEVMHSIKGSILDLNPGFLGHLKMFLQTGSVALRVSVTSYRDHPEIEVVSSKSTDRNMFTVFAAVTDIKRDSLTDIIEGAVLARSGQLGISA
ncbi:MAG: GTP-binding protein [Methanolobus sp.]|nr:GTP-binding protein [Methanolobus sp.]